MSTNISVCMMTLNEKGAIEPTLESVEPIMEELVAIDGGSTDGTIEYMEEFTEEHGIPFQLIESSEREYLLEGPGTHRRRLVDKAENDYTLAVDCDNIIEIKDEDWFHHDFKFPAYLHTRHKPGGIIVQDFRLHSNEKVKETFIDMTGDDEPDDAHPRWRGLVHEELRTKRGEHIHHRFMTNFAEAPMVYKHVRTSVMDGNGVFNYSQHPVDERVGGNSKRVLKKQHYLLHRSMSGPSKRYLSDPYKNYYYANHKTVAEDWAEIREEYNLPLMSPDARHYAENDIKNVPEEFDLSEGKPFMDAENNTISTYLVKKATGVWPDG